MASCAQQIWANLSLKAARLTAVYKSITFTYDCGINPCSFEMDDENSVRWIINGEMRESDNGSILEDIDSMLANLSGAQFCYAHKSANIVAKGLANFALSCKEDRFWMEEVPRIIEDRVLTDMIN